MSTFQAYLPEKKSNFVGRNDYINRIDQNFNEHTFLIIKAFGGTGKSSLALEFAHRSNYVCRWFDSDSLAKLDLDYRGFAEELGVEDTINQNIHQVIHQVNAKLSDFKSSIYFIFDNLEDYGYLKIFTERLPINIKVIITTRNELGFGNRENSNIDLEPFNIDEARDYIKINLGEKVSDEHMNKILDITKSTENQVLPIKIEMIVSYIKENEGANIETQLNNLIKNDYANKKIEEVLLHDIKFGFPEAFEILHYCSMLNPDFIDN